MSDTTNGPRRRPRGVALPPSATLGLALAALLAACTGAPPAPRGEHPLVLKLGHGLDTEHPVHKAMVDFAREVETRSGGSLRVDIYPAEQLGSERELLELLQIGSLGLTKVSASVLENFAPAYQLFSLPYLFAGRDHLFAVLDGPVGRELLLEPVPYRLRGLTYYDAGARSFYTRDRPINTPDDLAGLKIRTQESATMIRAVKALGGSPTPIAWGELYTALQQGVVDGAENNPPSFYLSGQYEVCRYYALDEHTAVPDVLLIGTVTWNRLSPRQQEIVQAAALASARVQRQLWQEATADALAAVAADGVEVSHPDPAPFAERVAPMLEEYRRDPLLASYLERIDAARPTARGSSP